MAETPAETLARWAKRSVRGKISRLVVMACGESGRDSGRDSGKMEETRGGFFFCQELARVSQTRLSPTTWVAIHYHLLSLDLTCQTTVLFVGLHRVEAVL
jgi:hypothetical protein